MRLRLHLLGLAAVALLLGCTREPRTPRPAERCVVHGTVPVSPGAQLIIAGKPRLHFRGSNVALEVQITGATSLPVVVHSAPLRFAGELPARDIPLRSARAIAIERKNPAASVSEPGWHIWIDPGVPLDIAPGLVVSANYSQGLADATATATCDAIALGGELANYSNKGAPHHLAGNTFTLLDAPHGRVVRTLRPTSASIFNIFVERVEDGYAHVVNRDWISIDGWVKQTELVPGYAGDCDDCRGGVMDVDDLCPDDAGEDDVDGCPDANYDARSIAEQTPILDDGGETIGVAEPGGPVTILERKSGRARILPKPANILPVGTGWWIAESALTK